MIPKYRPNKGMAKLARTAATIDLVVGLLSKSLTRAKVRIMNPEINTEMVRVATSRQKLASPTH